ncbi:MAG: peptide chain release factor N(5)-glutamine methyltransferase [Magnetospirillum sp.]|nr:peptide chain release factor N(5)-glutamine methyltransferase [Magnetospirillum sp.]
MLTAGRAARDATAILSAAGIDGSRLDDRVLVAAAMGIEAGRVITYPELPLTAEQESILSGLIARRAQREPVSRILGRRGFWTLDLAVGPDTLDPRPDTETVVEAVLDVLADRARRWRLLDLGTGSGCILLALLSELPNATGLGIDQSDGALATARSNAAALGLSRRVEFRLGDWGRGIDERFDAIVANPPYIPDGEIAGLEPEVAVYDPRFALAGGADGLDCYRALAPDVARLVAEDGVVALEVGAGQAATVAAILTAAGLRSTTVRRDLGGIERCVVAGNEKKCWREDASRLR